MMKLSTDMSVWVSKDGERYNVREMSPQQMFDIMRILRPFKHTDKVARKWVYNLYDEIKRRNLSSVGSIVNVIHFHEKGAYRSHKIYDSVAVTYCGKEIPDMPKNEGRLTEKKHKVTCKLCLEKLLKD